MAACGRTESPKPVLVAGEWREFEGSWNAAGNRRTIPLGAERKGSIVDLSGTMLLAGPGRPGVGFRSEVIALVDSETGLVGRGVWTDEHGDQVFSELKGEGTAAEKPHRGDDPGRHGPVCRRDGFLRVLLAIRDRVGGRSIQGRAVGLKGRVRLGQPNAGGSPP